MATLPTSRGSLLRRHGYPHQASLTRYVVARGCHAIDPLRIHPAVSVKTFETEKRQNRPGEILKGALRGMVETVEPVSGIRSWQPPAYMNPLTQHVEYIAAQTEIIRMRLRPLKTGLHHLQPRNPHRGSQSSPRNSTVRAAAHQPAATMHSRSAGHRLRTPMRLVQTAFLRNTSNAVPNSVPGCALTHSMQAWPQSSHDCHHSPAGHSSDRRA